VAILLRNQLDYEIISQFIDTEGRIILLNINIKDTIFTLVCLYAPNCKTTKNNFTSEQKSQIFTNTIFIFAHNDKFRT
jgi:exonuclease III